MRRNSRSNKTIFEVMREGVHPVPVNPAVDAGLDAAYIEYLACHDAVSPGRAEHRAGLREWGRL